MIILRITITFMTFLLTYGGFLIPLGLFAVASRLGGWSTIVAFHFLALVGGVLVARYVFVRSRNWRKAMLFSVLGVLAVVLLLATVGVALVLRQAQKTFASHDSDRESVPLEVINDRLSLWAGLKVPSSASDLHVVDYGGIDPGMYLRFDAQRDEARLFLDQVLVSQGMDTMPHCKGPLPVAEDPPVQERQWWNPNPDVPWWFKVGEGKSCFVQWDEERGTIFFMLRFR